MSPTVEIFHCKNKKNKDEQVKTKEKKSFEGSLKYFIPYTYIQKKLLMSKNAMSCGTWIGIYCKLLLATLL
jgi:hypothetical protein